MNSISINEMRLFLQRSISSMNRNKLNGILAEEDFRRFLIEIGFANRVSIGGWIARKEGPGTFGHYTVALFPEIIIPNKDYSCDRDFSNPPQALYSICSILHQIGILSFYCIPIINKYSDYSSIDWLTIQLGVPTEQNYLPLLDSMERYFNIRSRQHNFLTSNSDVSIIPDNYINEEFSKEHLRVTFQTRFFSEISDIDGIFWGKRITYPIEIKEKTCATNPRIGEYFGLDIGPFVKLAFYTAKRGDLHSLFVVREIDNTEDRNLLKWRFIKFEELAKFASWTFVGGGPNMRGGLSSVVRIPKAEFKEMNKQTLNSL